MTDVFPLSSGKAGGAYTVEAIDLPDETGIRLQALGMTRGTRISVHNSKSRGVLIVKIRGTRFALGRGITENISVRCADE